MILIHVLLFKVSLEDFSCNHMELGKGVPLKAPIGDFSTVLFSIFN